MTSFANYSSKNSMADANTASFIANIHPSNSKQMVYLTHDDLQKRTASLYALFIYCYISFLFIFSGAYLLIAAINREEYANESTMCKMSFFFDFYTTILTNLAVIIFLFKKYSMFQSEKLTDNLTILKDPKNIISSTGFLLFLFLILGNLSKNTCSTNMFLRVATIFGIQFIQITGMCTANLIYHFKICREFEISIALDEESCEKSKRKEEQFNGSFALNLSKISKSNKDKLKYRRRTRTKHVEIAKLEMETTVKDLDNLDIVRKSPEQVQKTKQTKSASPSKRLSAQFKTIDVDNE